MSAAYRASAASCGQNADSSAPLRTIALSATMKYRAGTMYVIAWIGAGMLAIGNTNPDSIIGREKRHEHGDLKGHLLRLCDGRDHQAETERAGEIQRQ